MTFLTLYRHMIPPGMLAKLGHDAVGYLLNTRADHADLQGECFGAPGVATAMSRRKSDAAIRNPAPVAKRKRHELREITGKVDKAQDVTEAAAEVAKASDLRQIAAVIKSAFDPEYYLKRYKDVQGGGRDPLEHYLTFGWKEGRDPNQTFSTAYYLRRYPDVRKLGVNPLYHYIRFGAAEGRQVSALPKVNDLNTDHSKNVVSPPKVETFFARLVHKEPEFTSKWLRINYLALGLTESERARCFTYHYEFIRKTLLDEHLEKVCFDQIVVWREVIDGVDHRIVLLQSHDALTEGELALEFHIGGRCIYTMSFTVTPCDLHRPDAEPQILISRVQGVRDAGRDIHKASKRMKDVAPPFALLAALQGLGQTLGIERLAGVSARHQAMSESPFAGDFNATYNLFFQALGLEAVNAMMFAAPLPLPEKPMSAVKRGHRIRTRTKRDIKRRISVIAASSIRVRPSMATPNDSGCGTLDAPSPRRPAESLSFAQAPWCGPSAADEAAREMNA